MARSVAGRGAWSTRLPRPRLPRSLALRRIARGLQGPAAAPDSRRCSWPFIVGVLLSVAAIVLWRAQRTYASGLFDLYPLYHGARAWLAVGNPYNLDAVTPLADHQFGMYLPGNGYPFPAVLVVAPLTLVSPKAAAMIWLGAIVAGLLLALRLCGASGWFVLYYPLLDAIRIEQYAPFVIIMQLLALWAYRRRRPWLLALFCALALTKPTQALCFVVALAVLARNWRQQLVVGAAIWGGSLALAPRWPIEWWGALRHYQAIAHPPIYWGLALFAIPLFCCKDYLGAATALQYLVGPAAFLSPYPASATALSVAHDRRAIWLVFASYLWLVAAAYTDRAWAAALTLFLPLALLSALRWHEQRAGARQIEHAAPVSTATA